MSFHASCAVGTRLESLSRKDCFKTLFSLVPGLALSYGLDDRGVRVLAGAGNFSRHQCVQTGSGAQPASYPMGTRGSYPESEAGWA
jgi:hypothetical protein